MGTFQRKTLRNLMPLAREVAEAINECDVVKRRLVRLMAHMLVVEVEAQAFRHKFPVEAESIRFEHEQRTLKRITDGRTSLDDLDAAFHDPAPLERRVLGE